MKMSQNKLCRSQVFSQVVFLIDSDWTCSWFLDLRLAMEMKKGSLRSDYDVNAAKKISISGNNFEALIMAVKYEGGSHGVLPKTATRWSRVLSRRNARLRSPPDATGI